MSFFDGLWGKIGGKQKNADGLFRKIEKKTKGVFPCTWNMTSWTFPGTLASIITFLFPRWYHTKPACDIDPVTKYICIFNTSEDVVFVQFREALTRGKDFSA